MGMRCMSPRPGACNRSGGSARNDAGVGAADLTYKVYSGVTRVVAALEKRPDLAELGQERFRQMFCTTCHSLAVTRGDETKLIGGDIGPELTKVASKVNPDWLITWLRDPQSYLSHALMPRYQWSDEDLYKVTQYINEKLTDPD